MSYEPQDIQLRLNKSHQHSKYCFKNFSPKPRHTDWSVQKRQPLYATVYWGVQRGTQKCFLQKWAICSFVAFVETIVHKKVSVQKQVSSWCCKICSDISPRISEKHLSIAIF